MNKRFVRVEQITSTKTKNEETENGKAKNGLLPVSPATWWRWVKNGHAPQPIKLGPNVTVWDLDELEQWLRQRAAEVV